MVVLGGVGHAKVQGDLVQERRLRQRHASCTEVSRHVKNQPVGARLERCAVIQQPVRVAAFGDQHSTSSVAGISHPYLNVGRIDGGTDTNVVPGTVRFKLDRRMIPEENPAAVEADIRRLILDEAAACPGPHVDIQRLLLADVTQTLQTHAGALFGQSIPAVGTPLYTDARLYAEAGIPGVIYGAGPRTVLESNAKRADEHLVLNDLRLATKVIARTLADLLR